MGLMMQRGTRAGIAATLVLTGFLSITGTQPSAVHTASAASGANVDWPRFGNTTDNTRFSPLSQINTSNVSQLGLAWTQSEGPNMATFETMPVVDNGVMYYTNNADSVRAVNAATGQLMWQYTPKVNFYLAISGGGGGVPTSRGVDVANGRVYELTFDNQLISLQEATGEELWDSQVADPNAGYSETSPPTYWNGELIIGSAESDAGKRGFVAAFDANTGKQLWKFWTVPAAGQGWVPANSTVSGGDVWMPQVVDTRTGIVYFGTGNPYPDNDNSQRPGCDPWVNSTVALDARTGKFLWAHSEVCNDVEDQDSHQPPMIFDTLINGKMVHAVGHGSKSSLYFVYDAATGKVLNESPYLGMHVPQHGPGSIKGLACPGEDGGFEYSPPAFSPATLYAYEPGLNYCFSIGFAGGHISVKTYGKKDGFMGAIDTTSGKIAWETYVPAPMVGGALATGGGLVFSGSSDGHFYAFDAVTGKILWDANTGLGYGAAPITYEVNGVQYIAIAAGGFSSASLLGMGLGHIGGTMLVFKLHGAPVTPQPTVNPGAGFPVGGLLETVSTKGYTEISPNVYENAATKRVIFKVIAGQGTTNNGFNFNGYAKGAANFIVPAGWGMDVIFTNNGILPHSAAIVSSLAVSASTSPFASTPNPRVGAVAGQTQYGGYGGFEVPPPGKYYLVCLVPGHITAGMWDYFTVSATATAPSIVAS
jgi:PQQ-dependent dehydrogenase (methanol/ethanol family)